MAVNLSPPGELLGVPGIAIGTAAAQVKGLIQGDAEPRTDLAVFALADQSAVAGVFTQSGFAAPPVLLCRERLAANAGRRAFLVNSGNANAATGARGMADARALCADLARSLNVAEEQVLPFSTGVIGEFLPVDRMTAGIQSAAAELAENGWLAAAEAIMTTDTVPKASSRRVEVAGHSVTLTGVAKGAGMMRPDMATMLAFVGCDASVSAECLQVLVREVADASFNRLSVDGDTSTNDSFVVAATGLAGNELIDSPQAAGYAALKSALLDISIELAQAIVRDGEGATKFVTVEVMGGRTIEECNRCAFTVAHSPLVKTAIFAGDPNWGRFCMAIGRAGLADFDQGLVALHLDDVCIARDGLVAADYQEDNAAAVMARDEYRVRIDLGRGQARDEVWTSDLSYEYVRINAEYRT